MVREARNTWGVLAALVAVVLVAPVLMGGMMGPGMMGGAWPLWMGLGGLVMLAFWGALALGVVLLVRWAVGADPRPTGGAAEAALDVLKRRYAAGEITREQYEQTRADLER
jgi:putative membrane protein